jgi:hypothetical protein
MESYFKMREIERERMAKDNKLNIRRYEIHGQEDTLLKIKLYIKQLRYAGTTGRGNKVIMRCARLHHKIERNI